MADERATRADELSRQDLVRLGQIKLQKLQAVDAELRTFGDYERYMLLAREQRRDARKAAPRDRRRLADEARANRRAATLLPPPLYGKRAVASRQPYDVRSALAQAETGDRDLSSLEPNLHRSTARHQRTKGLHLTGLAVLFIVGLVFFTLAAVTSGRRAYTFATFGVSVVMVAVALFPIVRWS